MPILFPEFEGSRSRPVNLEEECAPWLRAHPELAAEGRNPLLDPEVCRGMIEDVNRKHGVKWSYGGYLENRPNLWRGSYLDASGNYMHLGLDLYVPHGTRVAATVVSRVIMVDDDADPDGGWGVRVFLAPEDGSVVLIYAHLQNATAVAGATLAPGTVFAEVGGPPHNGNWAPHLHVQAVRGERFEEFLRKGFDELDGYGPAIARESLREDFPDPLPYLGLAL